MPTIATSEFPQSQSALPLILPRRTPSATTGGRFDAALGEAQAAQESRRRDQAVDRDGPTATQGAVSATSARPEATDDPRRSEPQQPVGEDSAEPSSGTNPQPKPIEPASSSGPSGSAAANRPVGDSASAKEAGTAGPNATTTAARPESVVATPVVPVVEVGADAAPESAVGIARSAEDVSEIASSRRGADASGELVEKKPLPETVPNPQLGRGPEARLPHANAAASAEHRLSDSREDATPAAESLPRVSRPAREVSAAVDVAAAEAGSDARRMARVKAHSAKVVGSDPLRAKPRLTEVERGSEHVERVIVTTAARPSHGARPSVVESNASAPVTQSTERAATTQVSNAIVEGTAAPSPNPAADLGRFLLDAPPRGGDATVTSTARPTSASGPEAPVTLGSFGASVEGASRAVLDRGVHVLKASGGDGQWSITLRVDPPALGRVFVDAHLSNNELTLQIRTETEAVRRTIESRMGELRRTLSDNGIRFDRAEVFVRSTAESGSGSSYGQASWDDTPRDPRGSAGQDGASQSFDSWQSREHSGESARESWTARWEPGRSGSEPVEDEASESRLNLVA